MNKIKEPLLSVIVPVYNVEKYLPKCIDSIINQTYKNIEIILIDDGSTDGSGAICDKYASIDNRIHVSHIENGGVSNARNVGISHTTGDYIGFVDGDDYIAPNMYERLLEEILVGDFDIVQCNFVRIYEDGNILDKEKVLVQTITSNKDALSFVIRESLSGYITTKLFKRASIKNVRFNTELTVCEDHFFVYNCCCGVNKIKVISDVLYYYYQRDTSAVHSFKPIRFYDQVREKEKILADNKLSIEDKKYLSCAIAGFLIFFTLRILKTGKCRDELEHVRKKMVKYIHYLIFSKYGNTKAKIGALLIWLMPKTFYRVYSYMNGQTIKFYRNGV